jgi:hypothetical protein
VYFKKDGIPWGTLIVGINESPNFDEQITLKPVPANDQLTISSSVTINEVIICDVNGKTVLSPLFSGKDGVINISELKPGFYLACIFLENGVRITKKMVVGKK